MRAQKVSLKSLKIAYVIVKPLYLDILVHELTVEKSYVFPIRVKLEGCQENFKVTLLERPPKKSCSTSTFSREISLQIFSPTFLKRFPCKLSKPSKSSKLSKISRQQATQACQAQSYISKVELAD